MTFPTLNSQTSRESLRQALKTAYWYHTNKQPLIAKRLYEEILGVDPDNSETKQLLGTVLVQLGHQPERALDLLSQFSDPASLVNKGLALASLSHHREAIHAYREAYQKDRGLKVCLRNIGNALLGLGQYRAAEKLYLVYHSCCPEDVQIWPNVIHCSTKHGSMDKVLHSFTKALRAGADTIEIWSHLAEAYRELGTYEETKRVYLYILKRWPKARAAAINLATEALSHGDLELGWKAYEGRLLPESAAS